MYNILFFYVKNDNIKMIKCLYLLILDVGSKDVCYFIFWYFFILK